MAKNSEKHCQNCLLRLERKILMILLSEKNLFNNIRLFLQELFHVFAEFFWQDCQKCNMGVQGISLRKNSFFSFSSKKIGLLRGKFWLGCRKCIPRVHGNVLMNLFTEEKNNNFLIFRFWAKTFRIFEETISASWPKLQSGCPGEHYQKKQPLWNKVYVSLGHFWTSGQLSLELWQK